MVDLTQLLIIIVVTVLTILVVVLGIQVYLILAEMRKTIQRVNKVLDDAGVISESVSKPINMASSALMGIKGGAAIAKIFNKARRAKEE